MLKKSLFICILSLNFVAVHGMDEPREEYVQLDHQEELNRIKSLLLAIQDAKAYHPRATSFSERRKYGYNGQIMPIIQAHNKFKAAKPIEEACVISGAQPSMAFGYWYADSHVFSTRFFFKDKDTLCGGIIEERPSTEEDRSQLHSGPDWEYTTAIRACCTAFSSSQLAILWEDRPGLPSKKLYITLAQIGGLRINLDENKVEINIKNQLQP